MGILKKSGQKFFLQKGTLIKKRGYPHGKVENFFRKFMRGIAPRLLGADGEVNIGGSLRREGEG